MKIIGIIIILILLYAGFSYVRMSYILHYKDQTASPIQEALLGQGQKIIYVAAGDSTAAGDGAGKPTEAYPYRIAEELSKKYQVQYFNFAVTGAKTTDLLEKQLPKIIAANPDLVTISIGGNDASHFVSKEQTISNYKKVIQELNSRTHAKVFLTNSENFIDTRVLLWPVPQIWDARARSLNTQINSLSSGNVQIVDIHSLRVPLSEDKFHPSSAGYAQWVEFFLQKIGDIQF